MANEMFSNYIKSYADKSLKQNMQTLLNAATWKKISNIENFSIPITPSDHFVRKTSSEVDKTLDPYTVSSVTKPDELSRVAEYKEMKRFDPYGEKSSVYESKAHNIMDVNSALFSDPNGETEIVLDEYGRNINKPTGFIQVGNNMYKMFSGSATLVNPTLDANDPEYIIKERILRGGLSTVEDEIVAYKTDEDLTAMPTSSFHPFTRMDPLTARQANLSSYNRSHTPIADLEFRKGFRHIFISRPECYITCMEGGLAEQTYYDEDFASLYNRMPYLLELLSPRYLPSYSTLHADELDSNWNFLLSNRVMGLNFENIENANTENITKTTHGYSIAVGNGMTSGLEGTLNLQFRDTKYFEIYELIRIWMLYIHKRHIGMFSPPFNGYQRHNDFSIGDRVNGRINLHPYDRAIEYPCTIFDIVTDESDTKILHYCEYIGAYPFSVSLPLNNSNSNAITNEMTVNVNFRYSAKLVNNNASLVHFNYNSGIVDSTGRPSNYTKEVLPFLISDKFDNKLMVDYIGQASLFTGSPYIVMGESYMNPVNRGGNMLLTPFLKFAPIAVPDINRTANMGIVSMNNNQTTGGTVGILADTNNYQSSYDVASINDTIDNSSTPQVSVSDSTKSLYDTLENIGIQVYNATKR